MVEWVVEWVVGRNNGLGALCCVCMHITSACRIGREVKLCYTRAIATVVDEMCTDAHRQMQFIGQSSRKLSFYFRACIVPRACRFGVNAGSDVVFMTEFIECVARIADAKDLSEQVHAHAHTHDGTSMSAREKPGAAETDVGVHAGSDFGSDSVSGSSSDSDSDDDGGVEHLRAQDAM